MTNNCSFFGELAYDDITFSPKNMAYIGHWTSQDGPIKSGYDYIHKECPGVLNLQIGEILKILIIGHLSRMDWRPGLIMEDCFGCPVIQNCETAIRSENLMQINDRLARDEVK